MSKTFDDLDEGRFAIQAGQLTKFLLESALKGLTKQEDLKEEFLSAAGMVVEVLEDKIQVVGVESNESVAWLREHPAVKGMLHIKKNGIIPFSDEAVSDVLEVLKQYNDGDIVHVGWMKQDKVIIIYRKNPMFRNHVVSDTSSDHFKAWVLAKSLCKLIESADGSWQTYTFGEEDESVLEDNGILSSNFEITDLKNFKKHVKWMSKLKPTTGIALSFNDKTVKVGFGDYMNAVDRDNIQSEREFPVGTSITTNGEAEGFYIVGFDAVLNVPHFTSIKVWLESDREAVVTVNSRIGTTGFFIIAPGDSDEEDTQAMKMEDLVKDKEPKTDDPEINKEDVTETPAEEDFSDFDDLDFEE